MNGGTTFHFVTDGIDSALSQARHAAAGKDIRIGGGVSTIRQYLLAVGWKLTPEQIAKLDKASDRTPVYPYWHQRQFVERNPTPVPLSS